MNDELIWKDDGTVTFKSSDPVECHPRTVVMAFHHPEYREDTMFRPAMMEAMQEYDAWVGSEAFRQQQYQPGSKSDTDPFHASNGVIITFMVPGAA